MEFLHCPTVDYYICDDFPCADVEGTVFCSVDSVNLTVSNITVAGATVSFTPPTQPYVVNLILNGTIVDTKVNPTSPILYQNLGDDLTYTVQLTISCPAGESKTTSTNFHTSPICVVTNNFEATTADVCDYPICN
jgi:hypothetical protein